MSGRSRDFIDIIFLFLFVVVLAVVFAWLVSNVGIVDDREVLREYGCRHLGSPDSLAREWHDVWLCGDVCMCTLVSELRPKRECKAYYWIYDECK